MTSKMKTPEMNNSDVRKLPILEFPLDTSSRLVFRGLPDEDASAFLKQYNDLATSNNWCALVKLRQFKLHLRDGASDWFSIVDETRLSWFKLEHLFTETFPYPSNQRILLANDRVQQPHEDLMTYYHCKMKLITVICADNKNRISNQLTIESIIHGMNPVDAMLAIAMQPTFKTPRDLYHKFILRKYQHLSPNEKPDDLMSPDNQTSSIRNNLDNLIINKNKVSTHPKYKGKLFNNKTQCYHCTKFGHKARTCRYARDVT